MEILDTDAVPTTYNPAIEGRTSSSSEIATSMNFDVNFQYKY